MAETLRDVDGIDAVHVRDRGMLQASDAVVLERAYAEDRVLATKNVDDFVKLAQARELHPGIILLEDGDLAWDDQLRTIRVAVAVLRAERDLVNRVLLERLAELNKASPLRNGGRSGVPTGRRAARYLRGARPSPARDRGAGSGAGSGSASLEWSSLGSSFLRI